MRGLSQKMIVDLSMRKHEPKWLLKRRLAALATWSKMPMPAFGPDLGGLNLAEIETYVQPVAEMVANWEQVPAEIKETFERLGIPEAEREALGGVGAQYDSELVYHNLKQQVARVGVVYLPLEEAAQSRQEIVIDGQKRQIRTVVQEYLGAVVPMDDHKFAALHYAVWSGGSFIYVPDGVRVEIPLQSYYRLNAPGAGQFEHTLIIVGEGADLHFIEGCSAPKYNVVSLHAGCVELVVKARGHLKYSTVESWSKNMYNLNTKRAIVDEDGVIEWVTGSFGSCVSMLYPCAILRGQRAVCGYTGVTMAGMGQKLDTGVKVIHAAENTCSYIDARSMAQRGGQCMYRSLVKVLPRASEAKSFADCKSLMLDGDLETRADAIPTIEINAATAEIGHEASVGRLSEEQLEYLMSRGITEKRARSLLVRGFTDKITKALPVEYAMEMNNLLEMEMEK